MTKEELFEAVKDLPENFELEDLFERLVLIKRIEEGLRQADNGETLTESEARAYLGRWLPGAGVAAA
jgi:predicted transcriptional regulator